MKVLNTFVLGTFMFITFTFIGCTNTMEDIKQLEHVTVEQATSTSRNISMQYSDSGKVKIKLSAPVIERFVVKEPPYDLMPEGLKIVFIDSLGNVEATVTSHYAIHYPKRQILELSNDVRVYNADGDSLNSEHLIWNAKTQKILSDDFVKITTEDEIIYGDGFEANQDFTNYNIKHIKGIISIDEDL